MAEMEEYRSTYLEVLKSKIEPKYYERLMKIKNPALHTFVAKYIDLCEPDRVYVSAGTDEDIEYIRQAALRDGEEIKLATPGHTVHFDNYYDQARDRENTIILVEKSLNLGFGIRVGNREELLKEIHEILRGIMRGHTLYVCFYSLGPVDSIFAIPAVQLTDSSYVAHSENILYRQGYSMFVKQGEAARFLKFVHSQGELDERKTSKNLDKRRVYIDLESETVYSANTQYGGNSIGLKKLVMRLTINRASKEGWLTEHMLLMGIHGPNGRVTYFAGAYPSMCGKTSTAMMEGETLVGDDIAYLRIVNGEVRAVNVEKGIFGIIQGINSKDDAIQWEVLHSPVEIIFSNVLVTKDGDVYWEGHDGPVPASGINHSGEWYIGKRDKEGKIIPCSHPNARFTVELKHFKNLDPNWDDPKGIPLKAIVYGGRDSDTSVPVEQSFDWEHGIITKGAALESETTAAVLGKEGVREFNPMSNLDFLSIPIGRYVEDNLRFGANSKNPPIIFGVNYFLRDKNGEYLTEKVDKRVWFKWMELRVHNEVDAIRTPTGMIPFYEDLKLLFAKVLNKEYHIELYEKQFTIRVRENLAKIDRVTKIYQSIESTPPRLFEVFEEQRRRLLDAQARYGDYISPLKLVSRE